MAENSYSLLLFIIGLITSTIIIYLVSRFMHHEGSFLRAFGTAIIGTIVYSIAYLLFGNGLLSAILGGIAWLLALKWIYNFTWFKALITAAIIWIIATIISLVIPTAPGPL